MKKYADTSVRRAVAEATAADHEALHHHPNISRLGSPELIEREYGALLGSYCAFYTEVEQTRRRTNSFAALSLEQMIFALRQDVFDMNLPRQTCPLELTLKGKQEVLGALYVLHGAGFGGRTLAVNVRRALPLVPCRYLSMGTSKEQWRDLMAHLEQYRDIQDDTARIIAGATDTFRAFGTFVTQSCKPPPAKDETLRFRVVSGAA